MRRQSLAQPIVSSIGRRTMPVGAGAAASRSSIARTPGTSSAAKVTTAPSTPAPISVVRSPSAALTGPVMAKDTGSRPIEISQSRLETRPSSSVGTSRCLVVAHAIVPAVSRLLKATLAIISPHSWLDRP